MSRCSPPIQNPHFRLLGRDASNAEVRIGHRGESRSQQHGSAERIYGSAWFIGENEITVVADANERAWKEPQE